MAFHNVPPNGFPDLPDVEELEAVEKDVKTLKTTTSEHGAAITALGTSKAAKADIAPTFSAESNYAVGDLVYYEGTLYECTTEHEAAAWDAENFTAASIDDKLSSLKSGLANLVKTYQYTFSGGIPAGLSSVFITKSGNTIPNGSKCICVRAAYDIAGMLKIVYSVIESSQEYIIVVNNSGNTIETSTNIFIDYI